MPYRSVSLRGEQRQVDVATGVMTVSSPWGMICAQAGDVLMPWGNTVCPIPGGLLDALEVQPEPTTLWACGKAGHVHASPSEAEQCAGLEPRDGPVPPAGEPEPSDSEVKRMRKDELVAYAEELQLTVDDDMTRDDLIDAILTARGD